jgi:hypothetical protein
MLRSLPASLPVLFVLSACGAPTVPDRLAASANPAIDVTVTNERAEPAKPPKDPAKPLGPSVDRPSSERVTFLSKHWTMEVPVAVAQSPHDDDFMYGRDESKIVFEEGTPQPRFSLYAQDLGAHGTGDIVADTIKFKGNDYRVTKLDGLPFPAAEIKSIPHANIPRPPPEAGDELNQMVVLELFIAHPDGSLQWFNFYIIGKMRPEADKYRAKALAMLATLAPGPGNHH